MRERSTTWLALAAWLHLAAGCNWVLGIEEGVPREPASTAQGGATPASSGAGAAGGGPSAGGGGHGGDGGGGAPAVSLVDCVLLMHMNEAAWSGADAVIDDSGKQNHGTAQGTATPNAAGKFDGAGFFDGSSGGWVTVPDSASLHPTTALTYAAWIYPMGTDGYRGILSKRIHQNIEPAFTLFLQNGHVTADIQIDRLESNGSYVNDRWQHVAVVYNGMAASSERVSIYIDGQLDRTGPAASLLDPNTVDVKIGWLANTDTPDDPLYYYMGMIDELAIWTRVLSAAEIDVLASARGSLR